MKKGVPAYIDGEQTPEALQVPGIPDVPNLKYCDERLESMMLICVNCVKVITDRAAKIGSRVATVPDLLEYDWGRWVGHTAGPSPHSPGPSGV